MLITGGNRLYRRLRYSDTKDVGIPYTERVRGFTHNSMQRKALAELTVILEATVGRTD